MNKQKGAIPVIAIIIALVVLVGGYFLLNGVKNKEENPSSETAAIDQGQTKKDQPAGEAVNAQDVSGEWNYTSKISGNSKTGPMTFKGREVYFDMMAARYAVTGSNIEFSVFGGFVYLGKINSPDFMSGSVTKDGKEVGTWDAKRMGSAETADTSAEQQQTAKTGEEGGYAINGNWEFDGLSMVKETKTILLFEGDEVSGMFTNGDSLTGRYSVTGKDVKLALAGGTEYSGTVSDPDNMSGKTLYNGSQIGTWSAKKKGDVKYDIRDNWSLITTNYKPAGSKPFKMEVIIGYMKTKSSVPPSMTAGKTANASDAKNIMDYKVEWPAGSVKITTWDGGITYAGNFVDENTIKGEFKGIGLYSDAGGTWVAERIAN